MDYSDVHVNIKKSLIVVIKVFCLAYWTIFNKYYQYNNNNQQFGNK